jgi:hypothetical protein
VSTDDSHDRDDKSQRVPQDNLINANAVEGLRLVVAFRKIRNRSDRRKVIELAERLGK